MPLLWDTAWWPLKQANLGFPCDPAILCPVGQPDTCALVLTTAEGQKRPEWPSRVMEKYSAIGHTMGSH